MISSDELRDIAKIKGIRNFGYAEKDYLLELVLLLISRNTKNELVFKGGTALYKFYKLDRFSEDLDFSQKKELNVDALLNKIVGGLNSFGIESSIKSSEQAFDTITASIRAKGPLFTGSNQSLSKVEIDINPKSSVDLHSKTLTYSSLYPDIPSFAIQVMDIKEIMAEKVRTILTRDKPRDIYDLWFLTGRGVQPDTDLISKKLGYYKIKWDLKTFKNKLDLKESTWKTELKPLISSVPELAKVKKDIESSFSSEK